MISVVAKHLSPSTFLAAANDNFYLRLVDKSYQPYGDSSTTLISSVTYEPFGGMTGLTYGNSLTGTYTYDQDYRLTDLVTSGSTQDLSLDYDDADNLTSIDDSLDSTRDQTLTYDNNGNIATDDRGGTGGVTFTYGNRNRMEEAVVSGGDTAVYTYNAYGQRVLKTIGATATAYQYDRKGHLIAESDNTTGDVIREYVYMDDLPIAQIESDGTIYYIHTDQTGTPQKMTDSGQSIVWDRIQDPFGQDYSITGSAVNNLRFPGQYYDAETATNQNWFRSYDSTMGRYLARDPLGVIFQNNAFSYVNQSPFRGVDRMGLEDCMGGGYCDPWTPPPPPSNQCTPQDPENGSPDPWQLENLVNSILPFILTDGGSAEVEEAATLTDTAINNIINGLEDITASGANEQNLLGNGGSAGAQKDFDSLTQIPGSSVQTNGNGSQTVTLPDGSQATIYNPSNSPGSQSGIQIQSPGGTTTKIKYY